MYTLMINLNILLTTPVNTLVNALVVILANAFVNDLLGLRVLPLTLLGKPLCGPLRILRLTLV